jgi:phenylpyruvate tautomerase PptA (4-oxalocrotonate tautomerase family)
MPFYQFTISPDSVSARKKVEIAKAITEAHCKTTGAPPDFVSCSFVEIPAGGLYLGGVPDTRTRMVGLIRQRPEALKRELLLNLAKAWSAATGEPIEQAIMFLVDIPGYQAFENGELLPEADAEYENLKRAVSGSAP